MSNFDAKIIRKALAIRMSKVLGDIMDDSQTACVKGRSVADNLCSMIFMRHQCLADNLDAVLISFNAKRAFDSVDHKYGHRRINTILSNQVQGNRMATVVYVSSLQKVHIV